MTEDLLNEANELRSEIKILENALMKLDDSNLHLRISLMTNTSSEAIRLSSTNLFSAEELNDLKRYVMTFIKYQLDKNLTEKQIEFRAI